LLVGGGGVRVSGGVYVTEGERGRNARVGEGVGQTPRRQMIR
jgi:hypothetical protein